jgi:hypothetical protein
VLTDERVRKALTNDFTPVMWKYDGIGGKVIQWTKAHGNTSDDPAHRIWILDAEGREISRAAGEAESPSSILDWLANGVEAWKKAKTPGIAHLFGAPPEGGDPAVAGPKSRVVWYAAGEVEGASVELRAAADRTKTLAEKVLATKKLESLTKDAELWRIDVAAAGDGSPLSADEAAKLPRLVVLGPAQPEGRTPVRVELAGPALTLDDLVAALAKLPTATTK